MRTDDASLFEWTAKYLNEHAQGVFLWVSVIAQELEHRAEVGYSETDIKDMVRKFPIELIDYYKRITSQLAEEEPHVVAETREMLHWTCYAERPLTITELRDIIAISSLSHHDSTISVDTFESSKLRRLGDVGNRIRRNCSHLLEIKKQRLHPQSPPNFQSVDIDPQDVFQLLHQTAREFLLSPDKIAQPFDVDEKSANNAISLICAHYIRLSLPRDHIPVKGSPLPRGVERWTVYHHNQLLKYLETRPLLHYVLKYLPYHLSRIARSGGQAWGLMGDYFHRTQESAGISWYLLQEWFERLGFSGTLASSSEAATKFRIESLVFGIKYRKLGAVRALSEVQRNLDYVDCHTNQTALQAAASCGDTAMLEFLIDNGANVNLLGGHFGTALQAAAYYGYDEGVTILLREGADPNTIASSWGTAFLGAACAGHEHIAKKLLHERSDTCPTRAIFKTLSENPDQLDAMRNPLISVFSVTIGPEHRATQNIMTMLESAYRVQNWWGEAEELFKQVMETRKRALGQEHPDTLAGMAKLAWMYGKHGQWKEAEELLIQMIETGKKVRGPEHQVTLQSRADLATMYGRQGLLKEAEELFIQVIEVQKRVLGPEHPDTLVGIANLTSTYGNQGRWSEAEELLTQVIETRKRISGPEHSDTLASIAKLAILYKLSREAGED